GPFRWRRPSRSDSLERRYRRLRRSLSVAESPQLPAEKFTPYPKGARFLRWYTPCSKADMLGDKTALGIACAFLLCTGCAAQQRRVAGEALAGLSALTTIGGVGVATGCVPWNDHPDDWT